MELRGADRIRHMAGGHSTFTVENAATGNHYTFKVSEPKELRVGDKFKPLFVRVLSGPSNESDYTYIGALLPADDGYPRWSVKSETPSTKVFDCIFRKLLAGTLPDSVIYYHDGSCGVCGRKLTTPESVSSGIGPICAGRR